METEAKITSAQKYLGTNWQIILILFILVNLGAILIVQFNEIDNHIEDPDIHITFEDQEQFTASSKPNPDNTERIQELEKQVAALQAQMEILLGTFPNPVEIQGVE